MEANPGVFQRTEKRVWQTVGRQNCRYVNVMSEALLSDGQGLNYTLQSSHLGRGRNVQDPHRGERHD